MMIFGDIRRKFKKHPRRALIIEGSSKRGIDHPTSLGVLELEIRYEVLEVTDIDLGEGRAVLDYWERVRGDAFAPAWSRQFRLTELPTRVVPGMTVIDRVDGGQTFYYRFWGTHHMAMKGFEMTGKTIDQAPNKDIQRIGTRQLETVIQRRRPTVFLYTIDYPRRHKPSEFILRLPLSDDGETVNRVASFQDLTSPTARWEILHDALLPDRPYGGGMAR
ncbi:MAG: hypothetical protein COW30_13190 [Rhodospirillales bacterium CG15_BIG_FIL_POST_REV_8_21_14_020_66_15]|nr:MAG: hypothetical protein COW30_13190 [Rhodospirillales bacterium CG15_BIG_FIL_POST_REV_8_21_14_020_66_15]